MMKNLKLTHAIKTVLFVLSLLFFQLANAELQKLGLTFPDSNLKVTTTSDKKFEKLKQFENNKKWSQCMDLAQNQFQAQNKVKGWVLLTWLKCSRRKFENDKLQDKISNVYYQPLDVAEKTKELFVQSSAKDLIFSEILKLRYALVERQIEKMKLDKKAGLEDRKHIWTNLDTILSYGDRLDKESKAKIYFYYSELAQLQHNLQASKQFLLQSLSEKESKIAREKMNSVLLALGEIEPNGKNSAVTEKKSVQSVMSEDEIKMETSLAELAKGKDYLSYIEQAIQYLNRYPNARNAKSIQDQVLEVYGTLFEKTLSLNSESSPDFEKYSALKIRALDMMGKVDPLRALDWARVLHRKNDFEASLKLSEKALSVLMGSPSCAIALYVAGRSAQFLGKYSLAQNYFEQYLEKNSGGDDIAEVVFRLGLVHIRQEKNTSAIAVFEKLLQMPNADRYELSARYWIVRLLQKQNEAKDLNQEQALRIEKEANLLIEKYPFSYYGIRLQAEKKGNQFEFSLNNNLTNKNENKKRKIVGDYYLSQYQLELLSTIQYLADNGWWQEAQKELLQLSIPNDPTLKILLAQKFVSTKSFPLVIKLTNEAGDKNPLYRSEDLIAVAYPNEYKTEIEKESKKTLLSPILVKSLIRQESGFGNQALSTSSAMGLMQLIPPTALEVAQELKLGKIEIPDSVYDPEVNIQMGTYYISKMIKQYGGCVPMGLAAYNAGPHRLKSFIQARQEVNELVSLHTSNPFQEIWFDELPWSETSFYVKAILRNSLIYKAFEQKKVTLDEIIWKDLTLSPDGPVKL